MSAFGSRGKGFPQPYHVVCRLATPRSPPHLPVPVDTVTEVPTLPYPLHAERRRESGHPVLERESPRCALDIGLLHQIMDSRKATAVYHRLSSDRAW